MNNVGLTILEGVATGNSPYKDPSKRNIGLLIQSTRGVPFVPTKVKSMEDFNVIFGGQNSAFLGPAIVKNIFDEAGDANVNLYLARVLGADSVVATKTGTLGAADVVVKAAYKGQEDPGAWGNRLKVDLYSYGYKTKDAFLLIVSLDGVQVESFPYSTLASVQDIVNKVSRYITVDISKEVPVEYTDVVGTITSTLSSNIITGVGTTFTSLKEGNVLYSGSSVIGTVQAINSATELTLVSKAQIAITAGEISVRADVSLSLTLADGSDGTTVEADFYPGGTLDSPTGLSCFDGFDVQVIACTEFHSITMAKALKAYVDAASGPMGLVNLPLNADLGLVEFYAASLQTTQKSFLTGLLGWVKVPNATGDLILIPALGAWLGAGFLRTPYLNGDFIHIPPAGIDSIFSTVKEIYPKRLSQTTINHIVQDFTCNVIQSIENVGFYMGSSRTYSTNPLYMSIHIRQQTSYYKNVIKSKLRYVEQKPNTPELKRQALIDLRTFFKDEYDNGALERSVPFDTAYQGICDRSNNPVTQDRKIINIDALWIPTECTESVGVSLRRNDGALTITEK